MTENRRDVPRYATELAAVARLGPAVVEATCTNLSESGAFLQCAAAVQPGDTIELALQPRRATAQDVELKGEIVYVVRGGGRLLSDNKNSPAYSS